MVYEVNRLNNFCGQWIKHSGWYPDWKVRLFNRKDAYWVGAYVHEKLKFPKDHRVEQLQGYLFHYSYKTLEDHWNRIERYTTLAAEEMYTNNKPAYLTNIWISPIFRFLKTYILKAGFLDGKNGFIISKRNAALVHMKYQKLRALYRNKS